MFLLDILNNGTELPMISDTFAEGLPLCNQFMKKEIISSRYECIKGIELLVYFYIFISEFKRPVLIENRQNVQN